MAVPSTVRSGKMPSGTGCWRMYADPTRNVVQPAVIDSTRNCQRVMPTARKGANSLGVLCIRLVKTTVSTSVMPNGRASDQAMPRKEWR